MIPFRQAIPLATYGVHPVDVTGSDRVDFEKLCGNRTLGCGLPRGPVRFARRGHLAGRTPYSCSMTREPWPSRWHFLPVEGRLTRDDLRVQNGHGGDQRSAGGGLDCEFPQARVNTA